MQASGWIKLWVVCGLLCMAGLVWLSFVSLSGSTIDTLQVHFLDVGQGDATLIQTPDGHEVLIDGGAHRGVLREIAAQQPWWDRRIDVVIATHPDTDHVGGLVDVLGQYQVPVIVQTEVVNEAPGAAAFSAAVATENAAEITARAGQVLQLGASTSIYILAPASDTSGWEVNRASVIIKVVYGDTAVLLTGDAPDEVEDYLADTYGVGLRANILKLGHHGSKTSTSDYFLDTVEPQYAIVSAGNDNRYGHPHNTVMNRVTARDITTFQTGIDGTISFHSDGRQVWVE